MSDKCVWELKVINEGSEMEYITACWAIVHELKGDKICPRCGKEIEVKE